jgi:hypothetical protein
MTLLVAGQLVGLAVACGLNLYLTVATLGILSRFDLLPAIPDGLQGLEGGIVIASAVALYLVETVIDKISHADSLWDTIHTFIRAPGAALLAVAALWGQPAATMAAGTALALVVALLTHGTKAGGRMALNTTLRTNGRVWISLGEDVLAAAFAVVAFRFPVYALATAAGLVLATAPFTPRLWRAFHLGTRATTAWLRSIFVPSRWRELDEMPRYTRTLLDDTPLGAAPPRGTRAALHGRKGTGAFRNGWLVLTVHGLVFVYRGLLGPRRIPLPAPRHIEHRPGVWAEILRVEGDDDSTYTLFLLKDGPEIELATQHLGAAPA